MEKALVVTEPSESAKNLTREAGELAAGVSAELVVLHVTSDEEYESNLEQFRKVTGQSDAYGVSQARDGARQFAANVAREVLDDLEVMYDSVGVIGEKHDVILNVAQRHDCDYIFLTGKERSPTGKALFGDTTQSVILNFNGTVVVYTE